jgi:hypothetical protein
MSDGLWVSFLPVNEERTLQTLKLLGEPGIVALKTTFLLGGNPDPNTWDEETERIADACFDAVEHHDLVFHFHTSAGGNSDINNFVPLIEKYGKRVKIHLVHFGGGVSAQTGCCSPPTSHGATSGGSAGRSGAPRRATNSRTGSCTGTSRSCIGPERSPESRHQIRPPRVDRHATRSGRSVSTPGWARAAGSALSAGRDCHRRSAGRPPRGR